VIAGNRSKKSPLFGAGFLRFGIGACWNEILMLMRVPSPADIPFICALEQRREYSGLVGTWSADEHLRYLADPNARYLIAEHEGEPLGFCILFGILSPHRSLELKRIAVASPGKGLGKEMLRLIICKAFDEYSAHRLWLDVFEHNLRAQRAYSSVGFRREGVLREAVYRDGGYHSLILMSILDREYREQSALP
jgi:diamine N-acetyltransferase